MQNRHVRKLALDLRKCHRLNHSWRTTSAECKVFTDDGRTNPGLAKAIAKDKYEPSKEVMQRLIRDGAIVIVKRRQSIFDMSPSKLLWALQHRVPMKVSV